MSKKVYLIIAFTVVSVVLFSFMVFSIFQTLEAQRQEKLFLEAKNETQKQQLITEELRKEIFLLKDSLLYYKKLFKNH